VGDYLIALLFVYVAASWLAFGFESLALYSWARRQGAPVSFMWSGAPGVTWRTYLHWCRDRGEIPDSSRLRRLRAFQRNLLASFVAFVAIFVIFALRSRAAISP
jgi:hypothetical protein